MQHLVHIYILFSLQYRPNITIQFRINNIYNNNYASAICHNIITSWRMAEAYVPNYLDIL